MADDNQGAAAPQPANAPSMNLVGQYIRDLSFENPGAPATLLAGGGNPAFNVSIAVGVKKQNEEIFAVELTLNAKANREDTLLFNVELVYGGIFRLKNVPEAQLSPLLMVECPRLVFPFARQVLANVTQQGGFPPLMMEPVDFAAIYRQNLAKLAAQQGAAPAPANGEGEKLN
ncbi:protein-export chaperone SecB [Devosia faecipullorum]|uniref:protein-export chaperone SecB n=1 Tax=Devosia faecipullorum TaxID=2755039 RepID=UPI00187B874D|nr:protein-export chaperone SecB [Devosia faecipullorum]MBE7732625.1 protein-export chaperone SecB [Devosia faecipullorum]